ncbi:MAG: type II secretion system protein M [Pseudomonadales bacterium]
MSINEHMASLRRSAAGRWFYGREKNEQYIIAGLAALITVSLLWVLAWQPISDWRDLSANRHQNAQQLYDWMRANESAARKSATQPASSRSLTPIVTRAASAHDIAVSRLQPESNGVISVVLQQQPFNKIVAWIAQMEENNGVNVERASMDSVENPGYVNAQIRLQ